MFCKYDFKNYKQLPKNQMPNKMRCRQKREEGQTKYRHSRQIVRLVWTAAENKQKGWGKKERKKGWSFLSGSERSDIYGWIGCSQSQARMTAENGAGLTRDDFARIFNSDQWPSCISLYRNLIRLYLHRYHCYLFYR